MDSLEITTPRQVVNSIEDVMRTMPQVELRVEHDFSLGVYARTLYIPKGVILTGSIHKYENLTILTQGEIAILIGDEVKIIKAPFKFLCVPGSKRIIRAIEDSVLMTVHGTHERDIPTIERELVARTEEEYLEFIRDNQLRLDLK